MTRVWSILCAMTGLMVVVTEGLGLRPNTGRMRKTGRHAAREQLALSHESRLVHFLMGRYRRADNLARPILNSSRPIVIEFALTLVQILDFDETNQVLMTNVWKRYRWVDELLMWNPDDFGGIADVRLPAVKIWTPDIVLYNNAADKEKFHHELTAVYSDGHVRWIPQTRYRSSCQLDMRNFPFDEQTCHFKFGSWTYDGDKLDLHFYDDLRDLDMREYINSSEWMVLSTNASYNRRFYPCCGDEPYPDLTFYLTVKRRTAFYIYVLILPSVLLSFLTLLLFWIPPQRPDRTSLGMSLFSSFFVLLLILVQSSPPTSASISLLGLYYCINMMMIAFSTMLSAIVINLTHYVQRRHIPAWLKLVCIDVLARVLCASRELVFYEEYFADGALTDVSTANAKTSTKSKAYHLNAYRQRNLQWRTVAQVIDRIFFIIYLIGMALSLIFVFPK